MTPISDFHHQLEAMRPALFRFAMLQLRNKTHADDAVQETLLAILEKPQNFQGHSSLRTYVIGILKFKIIDLLRLSNREVQFLLNEENDDTEVIDSLFKENGHLINKNPSWGNPDSVLEQKDFFLTLEICLEKLPSQTARVFMMREWLDLSTEEICKELDLSTSNLWVILYRARMRLRECLEINWFATQ